MSVRLNLSSVAMIKVDLMALKLLAFNDDLSEDTIPIVIPSIAISELNL